MKNYWGIITNLTLLLILVSSNLHLCSGDDDDGDYDETPATPPPGFDKCNGVFLSYSFTNKNKEFPHFKNASAQAWAFASIASITNLGTEELKGWKMYVGFHHREILVSASDAMIVDGYDLPAPVGNGTTIAGLTKTDLKTSIDTAGDWNQITAQVQFTGTLFGMKEKEIPMPKNISLVNDGYKCPKPTKYQTYMHTCCKKDPKFKSSIRGKFLPRKYGDLNIMYDVLTSYQGSYLAQVTMENANPIGRLDHWNLTWEWMRGEFIQSMKGAYTHNIDYTDCIYGNAAKVLSGFDFSQVMNCEKKPVITDLPPTRANDSDVGKIPSCCRNGTLLPKWMDESKSRSIFQLRVYKLPPDTAQTELYPPQRWNITGVLNPTYQCGPPIRVDPTEFPDPTGLEAIKSAVASWQVVCNITRPTKENRPKCCVSFSAFYNDSVIPCNTCACGCESTDTTKCNPDGKALLLPPEALLVPFVNRSAKAKAWASLKHHKIPKRLPCSDNCGVSINWHLNSDFKSGWTARVTLFNWGNDPFEDWFTAVTMSSKAFPGYENVYSFNGTRIPDLSAKNTMFFSGLKGLNYLVGMRNGSHPSDPRIPGKQQSIVSFLKKHTKGIRVEHGDGFPKRVYFNGEECALPTVIPRNWGSKSGVNVLFVLLVTLFTCLMVSGRVN